MAFTKDQELIVNFYNNIGIFCKGQLQDIQNGPLLNNFIYKPNEKFNIKHAIKLAHTIGGTVSPNYINGTVNFQIPKQEIQTISFNSLMKTPEYKTTKSVLPIILGVDSFGNTMIGDLTKYQHLLIVGRTGTGKSTFLKSIIKSLTTQFSADECKLLLIDTKGTEFFNKDKHLLEPVITFDTKYSLKKLHDITSIIDERHSALYNIKAHNIQEYNKKVATLSDKNLSPMNYIIVIIDEFADLTTTSKKEFESIIQQITNKGSTIGVHLIMATKNPSAITNITLANFPTRAVFQVRFPKDSIKVLGEPSAEFLLNCGDMLFSDSGRIPVRIHTAYISDTDITTDIDKELYEQAKEIVIRDKKPTISYIQRRLGIGYNKASTFIDKLEQEHIISAPDKNNTRHIL